MGSRVKRWAPLYRNPLVHQAESFKGWEQVATLLLSFFNFNNLALIFWQVDKPNSVLRYLGVAIIPLGRTSLSDSSDLPAPPLSLREEI